MPVACSLSLLDTEARCLCVARLTQQRNVAAGRQCCRRKKRHKTRQQRTRPQSPASDIFLARPPKRGALCATRRSAASTTVYCGILEVCSAGCRTAAPRSRQVTGRSYLTGRPCERKRRNQDKTKTGRLDKAVRRAGKSGKVRQAGRQATAENKQRNKNSSGKAAAVKHR